MGCTTSSPNSDQTGFAYGCVHGLNNTQDSPTWTHRKTHEGGNRRASLDVNGIYADISNNKDTADFLRSRANTLKFGPMCLTMPTVKVLLVFEKADAQSDALKWAAERLRYQCTLVYSLEAALDSYIHMQHHLVIIDARQTHTLDPLAICRSIRNIKGSQYTCLVGVVKKNWAEKEEPGVLSLLRVGYNRWFLETYSLGICLNELVQLEHNEISAQFKLKAAQALFAALDNCRDGIILTGPNNDIQFVNHAIEKLLGFRAEDMIGKNAQDLHKTDNYKSEIFENINTQINKGKVRKEY